MADSPKNNKKVSAPMIYALLIVIGTAIYLNLPNPNQTSTSTKKRSTTTTSSSTNADGITDADYKAHFPHYVGTGRNPYIPAILSASQQNASLFGKTNGVGGSWSLTGINVVNGIQSAVIESADGDSAALQVGDHWHGLRVVSLSDQAITFQNALGQTTQLSFDSNGNSGSTPGRADMPSLSQVLPLPAISAAIQTTPNANSTAASSAYPTFNAASGARVRGNAANNGGGQGNNQSSDTGTPTVIIGPGDGNGGPPPPDDGGGGPPQ